MSFDLNAITSKLERDNQDIWRVETAANISYPVEHHNTCFAVEENSFWFRHRAKCIVQAIRNFPPDDVMFDVGGGNGFMTDVISAAGFATILMEPGENGIRNAARRGLKPLICSTLEEAGFPEHVIPSIGVFDVVEHIEDDIGFLNTLRTHLVPGGKLYVTVPSYSLLWSSADEEAGHYRRYTLRKISDRLRETGFEVLYATYIFCLLPLPVLLLRSLPYRLGIKSQPTEDRQIRQHGAHLGKSASVVDSLFSWELGVLKKKKSIPVGASCLLVATAKQGAG